MTSKHVINLVTGRVKVSFIKIGLKQHFKEKPIPRAFVILVVYFVRTSNN